MAWVESFISCDFKEVSESFIKKECDRLVRFMIMTVDPSEVPNNRKCFVFKCNVWTYQFMHNIFRDKVIMKALRCCSNELEKDLFFPRKGHDRKADKIMGELENDIFFYSPIGFMGIEKDNRLSEENRFISKIKFITDYNPQRKEMCEGNMIVIPNGVDSIMVRTNEPLTDSFIEEHLSNLRQKYVSYDRKRGDITFEYIYHIKGNDLALKDIFKIQVKTTENFARGLGISGFDPNPILKDIEQSKYKLDDIKEVCFCPAKLERLSEIYDHSSSERVLFIEIKEKK